LKKEQSDPVINKVDTRSATNKLVRLANETPPSEGYSNQPGRVTYTSERFGEYHKGPQTFQSNKLWIVYDIETGPSKCKMKASEASET
jgi:hypothetical protein